MSRVLLHSPDERALPTVMRRSRAGDDVHVPRRDATAELDDLVARGMMRYIDSPDPLAYDLVIRGCESPHGNETADTRGSGHVGTGRVVLVGGGPGDPGLITVAGLDAIKRADVLVCDRLAPLELLDHAGADVEIVHVGKIPRGAFTPQETINTVLVEHALQGKTVVRLKGGDPFVFGRGGEEWDACVESGVAVEVIPGISSALAVPALGGIPVTHRSLTQGFTVVSGHVAPDDPRSAVDWSAIAQSRTSIVVLMGVATVGAIADALRAGGLPGTTPVAMIENGATPQQRVVRATLASVAETAREASLRPPAITVVGEVVDALLDDRDGQVRAP